jgi:hypothetical protein
MSGAVRAFAAALAICGLAATLLAVSGRAQVGRPSPQGARDATNAAAPVEPSPPASESRSAGSNLEPDQISPPRGAATDATNAAQLNTPRRDAASTQLGSAAAGRNTRVFAVKGHDRCDPASADANQPDCGRILDRRADDFANGAVDKTPSTVDPNGTSSDLVNGIVSGGTGSVVQLPAN